MKHTSHGRAFFAVKRRSQDAKCAPTLVAIVQSYDDAIELADRRNQREVNRQPFFATVHHG